MHGDHCPHVTGHDTDVTLDETSPWRARGECGACGWQGPSRRSYQRAHDDVDAHLSAAAARETY